MDALRGVQHLFAMGLASLLPVTHDQDHVHALLRPIMILTQIKHVQIGQALDPTQTPRLDSLEVYAKPRTDLDMDLLDAELAAESTIPGGASGEAVGLADSAVGMPGRSLALDPQVVACECLMTHALGLLRALHVVVPPRELKGEPCGLGDPVLRAYLQSWGLSGFWLRDHIRLCLQA